MNDKPKNKIKVGDLFRKINGDKRTFQCTQAINGQVAGRYFGAIVFLDESLVYLVASNDNNTPEWVKEEKREIINRSKSPVSIPVVTVEEKPQKIYIELA